MDERQVGSQHSGGQIPRPAYLSKLISKMGSGQAKVVTGVRRCGKSYLVFVLFKEYLLSQGVSPDHIIEMAFDTYESKPYRDPAVFYPYLKERLQSDGTYYVLLDEVQLLDDFVDILNSLLRMGNVDVYVTGSNAHLLSRDVVTEFRGRGDEVQLFPLSFSEFMEVYEGDVRDGYTEYSTYGGLPAVLSCSTGEDKADYLQNLFREIYLSDIVERNGIRDDANLGEVVDVLASSIGSLTNPLKISNTFKTEKHLQMSPQTVERYIAYLEDSFLVERAQRYDVKGRRYIGTPSKYYFSDLGLRNARLSFRQSEETHLMENVMYNELRSRGFSVDVGVVPASVKGADGRYHRTQLEVDFVCNKGSRRYYIQSAYALPTDEKAEQEQASLMSIDDSFRKIIVTKEGTEPRYNERGVLMLNLYDFLLDPESMNY